MSIPRLLLVAFILCGATAKAQILSTERQAPRAFGYFLGDLLSFDIAITAEKGWDLQRASLPRPGPITYWLDLRSLSVEGNPASGKWRLHLIYQNFYDTLDTRQLTVPGLTLTFHSGAALAEAQIPPWGFNVSPLREVQPVFNDPQDLLRADMTPPHIDRQHDRLGVIISGVLALLSLTGLAFERRWWPFHHRPSRPFFRAARLVRRLIGNGDTAISEECFRNALLAMHRAIDAKAGRRLFSEDITSFLVQHPAYKKEAESFARFFASSHRVFFASDEQGARTILPPDSLLAFSRHLATIERAAE